MRPLKIILTALAALTISLSSCSDDEPASSAYIDNLLNPKEDVVFELISTDAITLSLSTYVQRTTPYRILCHDGKLYYLTDYNDYPKDFYTEYNDLSCTKPWPWELYRIEVNSVVPFFSSEGVKKTGDKSFTINNHSYKLIKCYNTRFTVERSNIISLDSREIYNFTYEKRPFPEVYKNSDYYFDDLKSIWKKQIEIMRDHWGDEFTFTTKDAKGNTVVTTYNFDELERKYCQ